MGYLTACWVEACESTPRFPVDIEGHDAEALLDSGSVITLVRLEMVDDPQGDPVAVACILEDLPHLSGDSPVPEAHCIHKGGRGDRPTRSSLSRQEPKSDQKEQ